MASPDLNVISIDMSVHDNWLLFTTDSTYGRDV